MGRFYELCLVHFFNKIMTLIPKQAQFEFESLLHTFEAEKFDPVRASHYQDVPVFDNEVLAVGVNKLLWSAEQVAKAYSLSSELAGHYLPEKFLEIWLTFRKIHPVPRSTGITLDFLWVEFFGFFCLQFVLLRHNLVKNFSEHFL